ncbi:hypothetical protein EHQ13_01955 [Leptospira gomenensis]|nr:hypothetical protein EHQ13_01955 [Leptospira gomenensis]
MQSAWNSVFGSNTKNPPDQIESVLKRRFDGSFEDGDGNIYVQNKQGNLVLAGSEPDLILTGGTKEKGRYGGAFVAADGSIYYSKAGLGKDSDVILMMPGKGKVLGNDWDTEKSRMHYPNESKQIGQADLIAKDGTALSAFAPSGEFRVVGFENNETSGNAISIEFEDANGVTRGIKFSHLGDRFPSYILEHFKSNNRNTPPLVLKSGTVFGFVGTTGNHYVGSLQNGVKGPTPHVHVTFYEIPKQNGESAVKWNSYQAPQWGLDALGFKGHLRDYNDIF